MKLSRIDQIALNGGDGAHYKYNDVIEEIDDIISDRLGVRLTEATMNDILKLLVRSFPNDAT